MGGAPVRRLLTTVLLTCVVGSCSGGSDAPTAVRAETSATTAVTSTEPTPTTTQAPRTTEATTTTVAPECINGATENRNVTDAGYDIWRCSKGLWTFQRTETIAPPPVLDQPTLDWWSSQTEELRKLSCQVGFETTHTFTQVLEETTYRYLCDGGTVPAEVRTGAVLTIEEIDAALAPAAKAWARKPSPATYEGLAAAAQALVDTSRPFPSADPLTADVALHSVRSLVTHPGDDGTATATLDRLRPIAPSLPLVLRDGSYTVGIDAFPGKYRTTEAVEGCYWETLDEAGEINDNNFVTAAPQVIMTIRPADFAVNLADCGLWIAIG